MSLPMGSGGPSWGVPEGAAERRAQGAGGGGRSSEGSKSGEAVDLETRRPFCVRFFSSKSKTFILQEVLNASLRNKSSVSMRFLICI